MTPAIEWQSNRTQQTNEVHEMLVLVLIIRIDAMVDATIPSKATYKAINRMASSILSLSFFLSKININSNR